MKRPIAPIVSFLLAAVLPAAAAAQPFAEYRTYDGTGNNLDHPEWGSAGVQLLRRVPAAYADGVGEPSGADRPNVREISNLVVAAPPLVPHKIGAATALVWVWGQFVDHDVGLTGAREEAGFCVDPFSIEVPAGDPHFDPEGTGAATIDLCRSRFDPATGTGPDNPRQQMNEITAFIDASNVYGSDRSRAAALRRMDGSGRLAVTPGLHPGLDLLPRNLDGLDNAALPGQDPADLFLAGDVRANENLALLAMHTLWLREHNFWARAIAEAFGELDGDGVYQLARAVVGAEIQAITYNEFLPALLGPGALAPYAGYDPSVDPGLANVFSTAAYRVGHSMVTAELLRLGSDFEPLSAGHVALRDAFFAPWALDHEGVGPLLRGAGRQPSNRVDPFIIDDLRNFLFGPPGAGGFDLAALNLQRGRDHGLGSYNRVRAAYGLEPRRDFAEITSDPLIRMRLEEAYGDVERIDPWIGGLAEPAVGGGMVGETWRAVLADQFARLRDGDRFWYQRRFAPEWVKLIERQTLDEILHRNSAIGMELEGNCFRLPCDAWGVEPGICELLAAVGPVKGDVQP